MDADAVTVIGYTIDGRVSSEFAKYVLTRESFDDVYGPFRRTFTGTVMTEASSKHPMTADASEVLSVVSAIPHFRPFQHSHQDVILARETVVAYALYTSNITVTQREHQLWHLSSEARCAFAEKAGFQRPDDEAPLLTDVDQIKAILEVGNIRNSLPDTDAVRKYISRRIPPSGEDWLVEEKWPTDE